MRGAHPGSHPMTDDPQPAARRQRDAPLRRARDDDAAAGQGDRRGARCLLRRRADGHRHLQPQRHPLRPAPDPRRIGAAPALQHGDPRRPLRQPAGRRHRRRRDQPLRPQEIGRPDHGGLRRHPAARLPPADPGRRPHHRPADPARDGQAARAGRADPYRRPCRHQRHHVRRADRARHAVPPRGRGGPARLPARGPDRPARHRLCRRRFRLAAAAGLPRRAGRGVLAQVADAADGRGARADGQRPGLSELRHRQPRSRLRARHRHARDRRAHA